MKHGFTLIELLIVVAIIAILAAIALPNLLEAQTRSKATRAVSEQRTLAVALESYAVDHREYPAYSNPLDYALFAGEPIVFAPVLLTTPVGYVSSLPSDIFPGKRTGVSDPKGRPYFYMHNYGVEYLGKTQAAGHVRSHFQTLTGSDRAVEWTLWSYGSDLNDDHGTILYDPTNGTVSNGDIMRFGP